MLLLVPKLSTCPHQELLTEVRHAPCVISLLCVCQDDGSSPLYIASFNGHVEAVRALVESGVALNHALVSWCRLLL